MSRLTFLSATIRVNQVSYLFVHLLRIVWQAERGREQVSTGLEKVKFHLDFYNHLKYK